MAPPTPYRTAPDSMRPRIGSGVSGAFVNSRSHTGTPRRILSRYLPKTRRENRRAAGPDPEPRSPASRLQESVGETQNPRPVASRPVGMSLALTSKADPTLYNSCIDPGNGVGVSTTGHTGTNVRERGGLVDPVRRAA